MGALLRGVKRESITRGQVLIAPGSMESVKTFRAQVYVSRVPLPFSSLRLGPFLREALADLFFFIRSP